MREVDRGIFDGGSGRAEHQNVYTTNDHFGSPRINTAATGQVISRRNYHSFGEAIALPPEQLRTGRPKTFAAKDSATGLLKGYAFPSAGPRLRTHREEEISDPTLS